jgi:hypothetical protein
MSADVAYNERNRRERERMRALVEGLDDDDLRRRVNDHWTVAALLLHIAFWDARNRWLTDKVRSGVPFSPSDVEPDDVTWINDSTRTFLHAIPPRDAAELALRLAEEADAGVASLPPERTWPVDPTSLVNPVRAEHRAEHLDEIEAALGRQR